MRYLILSDIHANRHALEAVLADAAGVWDEAVCLGDLVGYGAYPKFAIDWVREHVRLIVRGNHDRAAAGLEDLEWFNPAARKAAEWTAATITAADRDWLANLRPGPLIGADFALVHGSPIEEDDYVTNAADADEASGYVVHPITFFGHSHLQGGFHLHPGGTRTIEGPPHGVAEWVEYAHDGWYLLNPGSVGQPRDRDPRAAYAIFDAESRRVAFRRVSYDIEAAAKGIRGVGLPERLANRLARGE